MENSRCQFISLTAVCDGQACVPNVRMFYLKEVSMRLLIIVIVLKLLFYCSNALACSTTQLFIQQFSVCLPTDTEIHHRINDNEASTLIIDRLRGSTGFYISNKPTETTFPKLDESKIEAVLIPGLNASKCAARKFFGEMPDGEDVIEFVLYTTSNKVNVLLTRENYVYEALIDFCQKEPL